MTKPIDVQLAIFWVSASKAASNGAPFRPARSSRDPTVTPRYDAAWSIATAATGRCCGGLLPTGSGHIRLADPTSSPVDTGAGTISRWRRRREKVCQCEVSGSIQNTQQEDDSQEIGCKKERWYVHVCCCGCRPSPILCPRRSSPLETESQNS